MVKLDIKNLYYITHINNIPSILENGILSHHQISQSNIDFTPIYNEEIVNLRQFKTVCDRQSLWNYANLYFQPRNPMMYRVVKEGYLSQIAIIAIQPKILDESGIILADGNAAHNQTQFYSLVDGRKKIKTNWKIIQNSWWNISDGSKRVIMSECLVPEKVSPGFIDSIFVADKKVKQEVEKIVGSTKIPIIPEGDLFFQPRRKIQIADRLFLIDGDMFFSNMQTLTISVNLQGVMGKGLASRAKYQFPDVYVRYQDACKEKKITPATPYLYKREASLDEEVADLTTPLNTPNSIKWFLLFATKRKWRSNSRMEDIESGLTWIRNNAIEQEIKSLALPALGCGLGNLEWEDVGPVMCRYLCDLGIDVAIYWPREKTIDSQYFTREYLLGKKE